MTPEHIRTLRQRIGTQQALADRIREIDPLLSPNRHTVSRWERDGGAIPNPHSVAALTALWLQHGYPCVANGHPATLTTNHPQSSWGQPVVVIDGVAHGSAEVASLGLGDAPESIRDAAQRAGYSTAAPL